MEKPVTNVLAIDRKLNEEFDQYCRDAGVRYPRKLKASLLEAAMKKEIKKSK